MCLSTSFLLLLCSRVASGLKTAMTVVCVERWVSASVGEYHWLQQEVPVNTSPVFSRLALTIVSHWSPVLSNRLAIASREDSSYWALAPLG